MIAPYKIGTALCFTFTLKFLKEKSGATENPIFKKKIGLYDPKK